MAAKEREGNAKSNVRTSGVTRQIIRHIPDKKKIHLHSCENFGKQAVFFLNVKNQQKTAGSGRKSFSPGDLQNEDRNRQIAHGPRKNEKMPDVGDVVASLDVWPGKGGLHFNVNSVKVAQKMVFQ